MPIEAGTRGRQCCRLQRARKGLEPAWTGVAFETELTVEARPCEDGSERSLSSSHPQTNRHTTTFGSMVQRPKIRALGARDRGSNPRRPICRDGLAWSDASLLRRYPARDSPVQIRVAASARAERVRARENGVLPASCCQAGLRNIPFEVRQALMNEIEKYKPWISRLRVTECWKNRLSRQN